VSATRGGTSPAFDRVAPRGGEGRPRARRDGLGKEALYSTAPTSAPTAQFEAWCRRCDVPLALSVLRVVRLLVPPFLWDPVRGRLWTRCPACDRYAWIQIRTGQALRVLLDRDPG
jgi:hypothetical protein